MGDFKWGPGEINRHNNQNTKYGEGRLWEKPWRCKALRDPERAIPKMGTLSFAHPTLTDNAGDGWEYGTTKGTLMLQGPEGAIVKAERAKP